ncbi:MAG TPA: NAD-dependent epimerase/dehydratase family protein [Pyrinomonadaceae bacterium]|nr:NAD-dependent epimerase/dehydratase family protein [Pyrinomonadaceae bacterium]
MTRGTRGKTNGEANGNGRHQNFKTLTATAGHKNGKSKPILITGGAGFIGSNLAHRLLSAGHRVRLLDNLSRSGVERNLRWLIETHGDMVDIEVPDVRNFSIIKAAVKDASQVFHFAAQVAVTSSLADPIEDFEINARGTLNLLEAIRNTDNPPPLVFTSTNKVYGTLGDLQFTSGATRYAPVDSFIRERGIAENRPLDFHSPYGCSKGAADQYVIDYARTYHLPALVFRMSCIYGPHQYGNEDQGWVAHFVIRSLTGKPITIYGDGKQVRDILFIEDLVDAFLLAQQHMRRLSGSAYNIGGGPANTISLLELLDLITELHGGELSIEFESWRAADQRYYVADTSKFAALTGWNAKVGVRDGVKRLYEWLMASGQYFPAVPVGVSEAVRTVQAGKL